MPLWWREKVILFTYENDRSAHFRLFRGLADQKWREQQTLLVYLAVIRCNSHARVQCCCTVLYVMHYFLCSTMSSERRQVPVALYVPNVMGYARILLAFIGLYLSLSRPVPAICTWLVSASLDLLDGIVARALNQTSSLGILLDICADNILRSSVWMAASRTMNSPTCTTMACLFTSVEWMTMLATQLSANVHWKEERHEDPWLVRTCFHNNFRNPLGMLVMYGLFSAGMWTYGEQYQVFHDNIPLFEMWRYLSYIGRALALCIELWLCQQYVSTMISQDTKQKQQDTTKQE